MTFRFDDALDGLDRSHLCHLNLFNFEIRVVMTIPVGEEIGAEVHDHNDQILSFVSGIGAAQVAGETRPVTAGDVVVVPAGTRHNFLNTGTEPLVLTTIYGPPDHAPGPVHHTKAEADAAEASEHERR